MLRDFKDCPHCQGKKPAPPPMQRVDAATPLMNRSDGESFHLYLQAGPVVQRDVQGNPTGRMIGHFRYVRDDRGPNSSAVDVVFDAFGRSPEQVLMELDAIADILAARLQAKTTIAYAYSFAGGAMKTLRAGFGV
jgi:hypothetical protein